MTTICRDLLLPSQPLAEKRIDEFVVSVKPIEYLRFLDLGECHLYRGGVVGCGGGEELLGAYRLSAERRNIFEDSRLVRSKLAHECREMFLLSGKDGIEGTLNCSVVDGIAGGRLVPNGVTKFLNVSRGVVCDTGDYVECSAVKASSADGKSGTYESEEVIRINPPYGKCRRRMVERAGRVPEHVRHSVSYASKKDVRGIGVQLYSGSHYGKDSFSVLKVEDILEFVKNCADFAFCRLSEKRVKNCIERRRFGSKPCINGKRRRARGWIDGKRGFEIGKRFDGFCKPSLGGFKPCNCGEKSFAKVGLIAYAKEIGMEKGDALHRSHGFKHKRRLAHSSLTLDYDVLPRFDVLFKTFCQFRSLAEVFSVNGASILERVHSSVLYRVWCCSILYYTILHNAEHDTTFRIQPQVGKLASDLFLIHNAVNA